MKITDIEDIASAIVIFGTGNFGDYAFLYCQRKFPEYHLAYCDSDSKRQKETFHDQRILSPQAAAAQYPKALYMVANAFHGDEMTAQLVDLGIEKNRIYRFRKADYYSILTWDELWEINRMYFRRRTGRELNKNSLEGFTDKMQYSKIYLSTELKSRLADKYLVREWVKERIGEEYLIPLLGVYNSFSEIDFAQLPDSFVLKANHGCKMNYIVLDKKNLDMEDVEKTIESWLDYDFSYMCENFELHYSTIKPCIIAEKYIEEFHKESFDYKFFCFNGVVKMIMIVRNIGRGDAARCFYDADFNFIPCDLNDGVHMPPIPFEKPECLEQMIRTAEKLSCGIDQVRVDLYAVDSKIFFGEMTFTSWGGNVNMEPREVDILLGSYWKMGDNS